MLKLKILTENPLNIVMQPIVAIKLIIILLIYTLLFWAGLNPQIIPFMGKINPMYYQDHAPFFYVSSLVMFLIFYRMYVTDIAIYRLNSYAVAILVLVAIFLRMVAQLNEPMTTDLYRYLANGISWNMGNNAYVDAPPIIEGLSFVEYRSMYPPGAEFLFYITAKIWPSVHAFKLLSGVFEIAFLVLVFSLNKENPPRKNKILLFFLINPVTIWEFHGEGHLDIIPIFLMSLSLFIIYEKKGISHNLRSVWAFWVLSLGFIVKYQAALLWPLFIFGKTIKVKPKSWPNYIKLGVLRIQKINWLVMQGILLSIIVAILPILIWQNEISLENKTGSQMYFQYWVFQHPLTDLLRWCGLTQVVAIKLSQSLLLGSVLIGCLLYLLQKISFRQLFLLCGLAFIFFFPVQHPWYSTLIYPAIFLYRRNLPKIVLLAPVFISFNYIGYSFDTSMGAILGWCCITILLLYKKKGLKNGKPHL